MWILLVGFAVACDDPTNLELKPCENPQEFGSVGCAAVEVQVDEPDDLSVPWLLTVSARWPDGGLIAHAPEPKFGSFIMRLELFDPAPVAGGDTASVWLVAKLVDVNESVDGTTEFLGTDSVLSVVRFSRIGETPEVHSIRLELR